MGPGAAERPRRNGRTSAVPPTNNLLQLAFGYNGLGRLDGDETGSVAAGWRRRRQAARFGGSTGILRLFGSEFGGQISWLLPAALISLVAMLW